MTDHEKVHYLTEAIFKNILENYNPGVKQLITSGRALQKSLHSVTTHAKTYIEGIYTLAQSAQVCKGATSEIGAALLQIAEVHKEINTQVVDNIKSFHSDLLIPLESKQENDFKHLQLIHKKYATGHKLHNSVFEKSQATLKKHKKKSKAKFGFDQKELQHAREVKESLQKLEDYQFQNLRLALMEERKRYCFLLDRICAMVRNYASHHSKAHEMFTHRLSEWSELCKAPHLLPNSSEAVINAFRNQDDLYNTPEEPDFERRSSSDYNISDSRQPSSNSGSNGGGNHGNDNNDFTYDRGMMGRSINGGATEGMTGGMVPGMVAGMAGMTGPYATTGMMMNGDMLGSPGEYSVPMLPSGLTIPAPQSRVQVRALYTHSGAGDSQLSFVAGDCVTLVGEEKEGWQYGENSRTRRMGWFPISFTEPISNEGQSRAQDFRLTTQRVKSLSNLHDLTGGHSDSYHHMVSGGHSDSDSVSVKLRGRHREGGPPGGSGVVEGPPGARPMSMHAVMATGGLQLPQRGRSGEKQPDVIGSPVKRPAPIIPATTHGTLTTSTNTHHKIPHSTAQIPHSTAQIQHSIAQIPHSTAHTSHSTAQIPHSTAQIPHSTTHNTVHVTTPTNTLTRQHQNSSSHDASQHVSYQDQHSPPLPPPPPPLPPPNQRLPSSSSHWQLHTTSSPSINRQNKNQRRDSVHQETPYKQQTSFMQVQNPDYLTRSDILLSLTNCSPSPVSNSSSGYSSSGGANAGLKQHDPMPPPPPPPPPNQPPNQPPVPNMSQPYMTLHLPPPPSIPVPLTPTQQQRHGQTQETIYARPILKNSTSTPVGDTTKNQASRNY